MYKTGIDVTDVTTTRNYNLGALALVPEDDGTDGIYMYVQSSDATTATVGSVVAISGGTGAAGYLAASITTTITAPGAGQGRLCGVVVSPIANASFGWVKVFGSCQVRALASCAAWTRVNSTATAGCVDDDNAVGAEVITGMALRVANGGATAATNAFIAWPTVGNTL